ncbi:MAG: methyltransferase domain-containing protein [Planctomycetes bacterium]|nr:methyltransferase domain-containing protein [Planctomycetota bacterium]
MINGQYIHYGCGFSAPGSWRNFDASPTLRFERAPLLGKLYTKNSSRFPDNVEYGDIVKGLPVADNSCKAVYCSHVLEHLCLEDFRRALKNTYRILEPGSVFRLVVPDLAQMIKDYAEDRSNQAAITFLKASGLVREERKRGIKGLLFGWLGNSLHRWMWDYDSMAAELEEAGFVAIRRAEFGDGLDPMFKEVEDQGRWKNCLGVECKKDSESN